MLLTSKKFFFTHNLNQKTNPSVFKVCCQGREMRFMTFRTWQKGQLRWEGKQDSYKDSSVLIDFFPSKSLHLGTLCEGFPDASVVENQLVNAGDAGSIPGLGSFSGVGNGNPLQYSCLENPMDRGAWKATIREVINSWTWLSDYAQIVTVFL